MQKLKLFLPLIIFVVLALLLLRGLDRDPSAMPSALIDRPVPSFRLPDLAEGDRVFTEALLSGQPALLNVWATWCPSCRFEHPFLLQLAAQGVRIVGLNYKDETTPAREWLTRLGDPYIAIIEDREGSLGLDLGVYGAPETYLVDANGIIRYKHVGVVNERVWADLGPRYSSLLKNAVNQKDK